MLDRLREFLRPFYLRSVYFPLFPHRKPAYFDDCWRYPDFHPDAAGRGRPLVLFLPMNDWHTRRQRTQHLAFGLSRRGYRCVYLNPHLGREFPQGFDRNRPTRVTQLAPNLLELHVHLPREPVFHHRLLTVEESRSIAQAASELIDRIGPSRIAQIVAFPLWSAAAQLIREQHRAPIVYDCHDYLPGFTRMSPEIVDREPDTFRTSDLVVCSSASLVERAAKFAHNPPVLIRNAADAELLEIPRTAPATVTAGYIGALDSWLDLASIEAAAQAHPEWRFHLIGRLERDAVRKLAARPNIHLFGEVPFGQLGQHLSAFTVGVIPFLLNPLIEATDPIKVYEYLAAGLPVVAADLPELRRFGHLVARYSDAPDFVRKLEHAVGNESDALVAERRAAASQETWDQRVDQLAMQLDAIC